MRCCLRGPAGAQGSQGSQGAQGAGGTASAACQSISLSDSESSAKTGTAEQILYEYNVDYTPLVAAATPFPWQAFLDFIAHVSSGVGTINLRLGGTTPGTVGGTIVATQAVSATSDAAFSTVGSIAAEPATGLVQVTATGSGAGVTTTARGLSLQVSCFSEIS